MRLPLLLAATAALAACGQPAPETPAAAPATPGAAPVAPGAPTAPAVTNLWNNGQAMPLTAQVAHPNGVVLQLTSLRSTDTTTTVGIRVINGRDREIELNRSPNNRNGFLLLENGERLFLSTPPTNPTLTVPAGQTFEGELVFLGRLPPVPSGVLVLNESYGGENRYTSTPGFRVDLPLAAGIRQ